MLGYALLKAARYAEALDVLLAGAMRAYPDGRFAMANDILREDAALVAAAWAKNEPSKRAAITQKLAGAELTLDDAPSTRFVLTWETDANDVDFHIFDGQKNHAFYSAQELASGGRLYADVTTGYGPECFTIPGKPSAYPYTLKAHYYSRGPMGYGMGKLDIVRHDGKGNLRVETRVFVVMNDGAYVDLGKVTQ